MKFQLPKKFRFLAILMASAAAFALLTLGTIQQWKRSTLTDRMFKSGGQYAIIEVIAEGADISAINAEGQTILIKLCKQNLADINRLSIDYILSKTAIDVNAKDHSGATALMQCASLADIRTAEHLIRRKAQINEKDAKGQTAMFYLCLCPYDNENEIEFANLLISHGADINDLDASGKTCISYMEPNSKLYAHLINVSRKTQKTQR